MIKNYDDVTLLAMCQENLALLFDRRALLLCSVFSSLGSFFVSRTILSNILVNGFMFTPVEATVTSAIANLIIITIRPLTTKWIENFEKDSGGIIAHMVGSILALGGTTCLAVGNLVPRWVLYTSIGVSSIGFGINLVTPLSIASAWSQPEPGTNLKPVNPSTMFSLFGTLGSLGGIVLPIFLGIMLDGSGTQWYQQYFFIIMALILTSAIGVPVVNYQVRHKKENSNLKSSLSFFGRAPESHMQQNQRQNPRAAALAMHSPREERCDIHIEAIL